MIQEKTQAQIIKDLLGVVDDDMELSPDDLEESEEICLQRLKKYMKVVSDV